MIRTARNVYQNVANILLLKQVYSYISAKYDSLRVILPARNTKSVCLQCYMAKAEVTSYARASRCVYLSPTENRREAPYAVP